MLKKIIHNHNWMIEQIIRSIFGPRVTLSEVLNRLQMSVVNIDKAELVLTKTTSPDKSLQDSDSVIRLPLKGQESSTGIRVRFLVEHKSSIDISGLIRQILRYQYGLYQHSKEPIITVVVNNGPVTKFRENISFQDWTDDPGNDFWQTFGDYVLQFNILVLNLQDPEVQNRLLSSDSPAALGLYAMGKVNGSISRQDAMTMLHKSREFDAIGIDEIWLPVMEYLNYYHSDLTMSWWQQLELEETGDSRIMSMALSSLEQRRQEGIQEGIELVAKRLLQNGVDENLVRENTQLSEEKIQELKNGNQDSK